MSYGDDSYGSQGGRGMGGQSQGGLQDTLSQGVDGSRGLGNDSTLGGRQSYGDDSLGSQSQGLGIGNQSQDFESQGRGVGRRGDRIGLSDNDQFSTGVDLSSNQFGRGGNGNDGLQWGSRGDLSSGTSQGGAFNGASGRRGADDLSTGNDFGSGRRGGDDLSAGNEYGSGRRQGDELSAGNDFGSGQRGNDFASSQQGDNFGGNTRRGGLSNNADSGFVGDDTGAQGIGSQGNSSQGTDFSGRPDTYGATMNDDVSFGDKMKGGMQKLAGKLKNDDELYAKGQARQSGSIDDGNY